MASDTMPLVVTRGDGIPVPDQKMGVELFKAQSRVAYLERRCAELEAGLRGLCNALHHRHYGRMPDEAQTAYDNAWTILEKSDG